MQEEKIRKDDKAIKYGKKVIALMIFLFVFLLFKVDNSIEMGSFNLFLFNVGIYFIFIEILIFSSSHIQKIKSQSMYVNIFLLLILLCSLTYILTGDLNILLAALIIILFWAFKEIFLIKRLRITIIVLFVLFKSFAVLDIPDYCQEIENGWSCNLKDRDNKNTYYEEEFKIKRLCKGKGGIPDCNGPCDKVYCFIPFDDAGKECINSSQCKGSCIGDYGRITNKYDGAQTPRAVIECEADDTCSGTCSEIPKIGSCIWYFEVNDGYYIFHGGGWC